MGYWKSLLPPLVWEPLNEVRRDYFPDRRCSYSGEGEDLILAKIFGDASHGFYIDVGCYHPKINSNTYSFYRRGWNGVNIDANPESIRKFNAFRPRDKNINVGISSEPGELPYYMFNEPAINTFSKDLYETRLKIPWVTFSGISMVQTKPLRDVLDSIPLPAEIDLLDVDVEGFDLDVLRSNDWNRFLPKVVMVEEQNTSATSFEDLETFKYLVPRGYALVAKTYSTVIFARTEFLKKII